MQNKPIYIYIIFFFSPEEKTYLIVMNLVAAHLWSEFEIQRLTHHKE